MHRFFVTFEEQYCYFPISMNLKKTLDYLYGLTTKGIKLGLDRVEGFLEVLGNPHKNIRSVHIAGTNGKGSVAVLVDSVLRARGLKTGLYTSPHILRFNERIQVNGRAVSDRALAAFVQKYRRHFDRFELTFFEITTALAFDHFSRSGVDIAVVETGMGGRFDATNVLTPLVSVITDITMDHQQHLGNTIGKIAYEKAGIIKPGVPLVFGVSDKRARRAVLKRAGVYTDVLRDYNAYTVSERPHGFSFRVIMPGRPYSDLFVSMPGGHQRQNALLALGALDNLGIAIPIRTIRKGFGRVRMPARLELRRGRSDLLFDVSHNPAAIAALDRHLERFFPDRKTVIVFGVMADKDHRSMVKSLDRNNRIMIFTRPKTPRAQDPARLARLSKSAQVVPDVKNALKQAKKIAGKNGLVVVAGSFFTVAEVYPKK
jgi:dihydrofolate synthase/folylpolyglutamate synthase